MLIDHIIYATADLKGAAARVANITGWNVVDGGRHVGWGTENMIIPLEGAYVELLAVVDEGGRSPLVAALAERLRNEGEGLWMWSAAVDDVAPVAEVHGTEVLTVERDGLRAQITGIERAIAEPWLPFFIARDPGIPGPGDGPGFDWVEVEGDESQLVDWLGGAGLPLRVVPGHRGVRAACVTGRELRTG